MQPLVTNKILAVTSNSDGIYYKEVSYGYPKVAVYIPHTHSFTYSASGATITATCGATGCDLTDSKATLTIVKPTLTTYGETGKSEAATLDGVADFNTATGKDVKATDIRYVGRDGTTYAESTTGPIDAGKYTAKITLSGVKTSAGDNQSVTASVDYEIAKAATSVTTTPTAGEITYGQTLADSTLTGGAGSVAGTFAWKNTTIAPAVSDSETTEYDVVFTPTDGNYSTAECKVKLTVNKADPTNTVGQLSAFRGQTLADVTLPTADNGTWSWEGDTTTTLNDLGMTTHFAKFTPNDTNNYNTLENVSVQIEVAEKPMAVPATVTANNRTYDGTEKALVTVDNSTLVGGGMRYALGTDATTAPDASLYTTSIPTATNAGTYYVWYKVVGDANHNDYGPYPVTASILNAKIEPKAPTGESLVYNGKDQPLVKAGSVEGGVGTLLYAVGKDGKTAPTGGWSEAVPSARDAGTYYVWYKVQGDKNHNDTEPVALEAEIGKKSLVVNPEAQRKTYGETDPELTWTQEGLVDGDALDVTLKRAEGENVGGYAITVEKCEASDNYEAGFNEAVFTIEARSVTVTAKDQTITDGGAIKTGVKQATLSGQVKGHALSAVTLAAKGDEIAASGAKIADAEGKDVTGNYNISYAAGKLTVDSKPTVKPTVKPTKTPKPTAKPTAKPTKTPKPTATPKPAADPDFTLLAKMVVSGDSKTALKIAWTKVADADGYDVYFAKCGRDFKLKKTVKASESRVVRFKGLDKRENYKGYVRAWKIVKGQKVYIGKDSPQVHAITGGYDADYCNTRSVKLNHSSLTLKTGKRTTLKATVKGVKRGKKVLQHVRKVRFYSTNANVASVTSGGQVKGVGKGTCTVYAIANNGVRAKVKVTVK